MPRPAVPARFSFANQFKGGSHVAGSAWHGAGGVTQGVGGRSDLQERYEPYCADFGPVNLGVVHRFCTLMTERMTDPRLTNRHLMSAFPSPLSPLRSPCTAYRPCS